MGVFEVTRGTEVYEIEAPDEATALKAFGQMIRAPTAAPAKEAPNMGFATPAQRDGSTREGDLLSEALTQRREQGSLGPVAAALRGFNSFIPGEEKLVAAASAALGRGQGATYGERYSDELMRQRMKDEADKAVNSKSRLGGQAAGLVGTGLAMPQVALAKGAGMGAQMINAAATGGLYGGVSGVLGEDGGIADKAKAGAGGTVLGLGLGAVAPPVIRGVGAATEFLGNALGAPVRAIRGALNPEAEAARRVGTALSRDGVVDPAVALAKLGPEGVIADVGGATTRSVARSAANTSPEARGLMEKTVQDRFSGQTGRTADTVRSGGRSNAGQTLDDLQAAAKTENNINYKQAYKEGESGVITPGLDEAIQAPAVQAAISKTVTSAKNTMVAEGQRPIGNPFHFDPKTGVYSLKADAQGNRVVPNLRFWDKVKQNIDDQVSEAYRKGNKNEGNDIRDLNRMIVKELDNAAPSYAAARKGASEAFGAGDALEAGQNYVTSKMPIRDAVKGMQKMTPSERKLFREGFRTALIQKIEAIGDPRDVTKAVMNSPAAREQMKLGLGSRGFREFEARMQAEKTMDAMRGALGNSSTARQMAEMGLAGGANSLYQGDLSLTNFGVGAAAAKGVRMGMTHVDQRVARKVGEMLMSNDPRTLDRLVSTASKQPAIMKALRVLEGKPAAMLGNSSGGMLRIGGPQQPVHAQEEDPRAPRVRN